MNLTRWIPLALLAAYSGVLVCIELQTSQDAVRPYFTDVRGEVFLYAVNTTLSMALLGGAALLLLFAAAAGPGGGGDGARPFLLSQAAIFALLAFDDRFLLHESIAYKFGVGDHYVMAIWALAELAFLALFCRPRFITPAMAAWFAAGVGCFGVMMLFDIFVPNEAVLRLSIEDLAKSWGAASFFAFGWTAARFHLAPACAPHSAAAAPPALESA